MFAFVLFVEQEIKTFFFCNFCSVLPLVPVVEEVDSSIHLISHYPLYESICLVVLIEGIVIPLNNWGLDDTDSCLFVLLF